MVHVCSVQTHVGTPEVPHVSCVSRVAGHGDTQLPRHVGPWWEAMWVPEADTWQLCVPHGGHGDNVTGTSQMSEPCASPCGCPQLTHGDYASHMEGNGDIPLAPVGCDACARPCGCAQLTYATHVIPVQAHMGVHRWHVHTM